MLFIFVFVGLMSLVYAERMTDIEALRTMMSAVGDVWLPVIWFTGLAGFAVAILYSGAFDVRPLIDETTVYDTLGILDIVLFAAVESLVSEVVEARLGLPDTVGAALSGTIVGATASASCSASQT